MKTKTSTGGPGERIVRGHCETFEKWVSAWRDWHEKCGVEVTRDMLNIAQEAWEAATQACLHACEDQAEVYCADYGTALTQHAHSAIQGCVRAIRAI